jgi:hypothetical protein
MFVQLTKAFLGKPAGERIDVSEEDANSLRRIKESTALLSSAWKRAIRSCRLMVLSSSIAPGHAEAREKDAILCPRRGRSQQEVLTYETVPEGLA